jgi:hypothetical protein
MKALQSPETARLAIDRFWYSVQAFLVAAANVSKLLWAEHTAETARGAELRNCLDIDDSSPLAHRRMRNHFEHFGERMDAWVKSANGAHFVDCNIGAPLGPGSEKCLRNYDPKQQALTFQDESYALRPICDALEKLAQDLAIVGEKSMRPVRKK